GQLHVCSPCFAPARREPSPGHPDTPVERMPAFPFQPDERKRRAPPKRYPPFCYWLSAFDLLATTHRQKHDATGEQNHGTSRSAQGHDHVRTGRSKVAVATSAAITGTAAA